MIELILPSGVEDGKGNRETSKGREGEGSAAAIDGGKLIESGADRINHRGTAGKHGVEVSGDDSALWMME